MRGTRIGNRVWRAGLRLAMVAGCLLVVCSCRQPEMAHAPFPSPYGPPATMPYRAVGPQQAYSPAIAAGYAPAMTPDCPLPTPCPGGCPTSRQMRDEYLCDGGDQGQSVTVTADWEVRGLNLEDTVAHYDTLDGRTLVEASNQVCLYSPRFGSVRQVVGLRENERLLGSQGLLADEHVVVGDELIPVAVSTQQLGVQQESTRRLANVVQARERNGVLSNRLGPETFYNMFGAYENFAVVRTGTYEMAEMPFLANSVDAAITWTSDQAVQVILDHQKASEVVRDQSVETHFVVDEEEGSPKLRVLKLASSEMAAPGETVDFTIRFDNVGNEVIGNVVILDNLTTRLAYVPDTAQCSLEAGFFTSSNTGSSDTLRWEVTNPIEPGEGGIIRFQCRVR